MQHKSSLLGPKSKFVFFYFKSSYGGSSFFLSDLAGRQLAMELYRHPCKKVVIFNQKTPQVGRCSQGLNLQRAALNYRG
jgi:hypothetical protein